MLVTVISPATSRPIQTAETTTAAEGTEPRPNGGGSHHHVIRRERKKGTTQLTSFDGELDNFQQAELILIRFVRVTNFDPGIWTTSIMISTVLYMQCNIQQIRSASHIRLVDKHMIAH